jgi:hypothetical protein
MRNIDFEIAKAGGCEGEQANRHHLVGRAEQGRIAG